jgi:tRNA dimethylallyltransferase
MNKLLVIAGPTATGKTRLAIDLSKKFNGEIVSADSRQVYKGMDIITGKETARGVRIWLYDVIKPNQKFSVADYYDLAWKAITDIWERKKLPILVGGTGFYVKAVLEGIGTMGIGPDWNLRSKLSNYQINELQIYLKKLDRKRWEKMNESDRQNPRRLIRAIEIAKNRKSLTVNRESSNFDSLMIGLTAPYKVLYQRIDERVEERLKMGAEREIKKLLDQSYDWDNSVLGTTIGYREWRDFFEGKASKEEVIQKWKYDEHNYARRQMTWFKRMAVVWFNISLQGWQEVEKLVKAWYS